MSLINKSEMFYFEGTWYSTKYYYVDNNVLHVRDFTNGGSKALKSQL